MKRASGFHFTQLFRNSAPMLHESQVREGALELQGRAPRLSGEKSSLQSEDVFVMHRNFKTFGKKIGTNGNGFALVLLDGEHLARTFNPELVFSLSVRDRNLQARRD